MTLKAQTFLLHLQRPRPFLLSHPMGTCKAAVLRRSQSAITHLLGEVFCEASSAIIFPEVHPTPGTLTALHWQLCSAVLRQQPPPWINPGSVSKVSWAGGENKRGEAALSCKHHLPQGHRTTLGTFSHFPLSCTAIAPSPSAFLVLLVTQPPALLVQTLLLFFLPEELNLCSSPGEARVVCLHREGAPLTCKCP